MKRWSAETRAGGWRYKVRGIAPDNQGANFTLLRLAPDRWRVVGNASSGERRKVRFDAAGIEAALQEAEKILGYQAPPPPENALTLKPDEVFTRWLESRERSQKTRRDYRNYIASFLGWVDQTGSLPHFSDIRLEHIQSYANHLQRAEYANDTIRLYLFPLTSAFRWAASNWPGEIQDVTVGLHKPHQPRRVYKADITPCLTFPQVTQFLDHLQDPGKSPEGRKILLGVALQGLVGLRLTEVMRLTQDKLIRDTLTVEGVTKNESSLRRIPLPAVVLEMIEDYGELPNGRFITYRELGAYSKAIIAELKAWGSTIDPKDLRKTLPTEFQARGFHGWAMERYIGHAARTVTERHYVSLSEVKMLNIMRVQVCRPINRILRRYRETFRAKRYENGTIDNVVYLREARKCS